MTEPTKATRATVTIGTLTIEGFMLPDGSYQMSQTQAAESVDLTARNAFDFLRSRAFKALAGKGYTLSPSEIEADDDQGRGGSRIVALPLEVVGKYWLYQASKGNKKALALVDALITESLERRFDAAFEVTRTEQERDDRLSSRIQQLERDLTQLGEAYALDEVTPLQLEAVRDELRYKDNEITRLRNALEERGFDVDEV